MKTVPIEFKQVVDSYQEVRRGGKAAGVDRESIEEFEGDLENRLYLIYNRLCSGSYHPPAVRLVEIPKKDGKKRTLGIPTVGDKVAQNVIKRHLEKTSRTDLPRAVLWLSSTTGSKRCFETSQRKLSSI